MQSLRLGNVKAAHSLSRPPGSCGTAQRRHQKSCIVVYAASPGPTPTQTEGHIYRLLLEVHDFQDEIDGPTCSIHSSMSSRNRCSGFDSCREQRSAPTGIQMGSSMVAREGGPFLKMVCLSMHISILFCWSILRTGECTEID